jgi:hypothetical protein
VTGLSEATEAYAAYLNARVPFDDPQEQQWFNEDLLKAKRELEIVWLTQSQEKTA